MIKAYFFPKRSQLRDNQGLTLKLIVDPTSSSSPWLGADSTTIAKTIQIRWLFGPYLLCPQHIFLTDQKAGKRKGEPSHYGGALEAKEEANETSEESAGNSFIIKCIVRVHPALSAEDVAWTLKPISRERRKLVRVKPETSAFNETVRVAPVSSPSGDNVSLVDLAIMESWVKNRRASSKYLLDLTVEKNSRFATASIQIQWNGGAGRGGLTSLFFLAVFVASVVSA